MKTFNNSLLNIVSPPPAAIASNNKNNFCLLPNLPVHTVASGSLLPSNSIDSLSVSSQTAATNSVGSILLSNNNSTKNASTVAAMVAAFNNKGIQRQPSATVVSSSQLMVAHSNGVSDGGGAMLYGGGSHRHQRLPLNPSICSSQQSSTHHMATANAIAVAIAAAAAATAAQQQLPYRHQPHYQTSAASASRTTTAFLPMSAFRTKKTLSSKAQTNVVESIVPSTTKQLSTPAVRTAATLTTSDAGTATATSIIPSVYVPSGDGGTDTTVCTLAATVGATSAISTLASPVPSV
uniref:Uncharacterized protein n=1 Tax=Anopheles maculatus TaxID=74869 RepID=A0A182SFJ6_9DIPT